MTFLPVGSNCGFYELWVWSRGGVWIPHNDTVHVHVLWGEKIRMVTIARFPCASHQIGLTNQIAGIM